MKMILRIVILLLCMFPTFVFAESWSAGMNSRIVPIGEEDPEWLPKCFLNSKGFSLGLHLAHGPLRGRKPEIVVRLSSGIDFQKLRENEDIRALVDGKLITKLRVNFGEYTDFLAIYDPNFIVSLGTGNRLTLAGQETSTTISLSGSKRATDSFLNCANSQIIQMTSNAGTVGGHYLCTEGSRRFFAQENSGGCVWVRHEENSQLIFGSMNYVFTYFPDSVVRENNSVKYWYNAYFPNPYPDSEHGRFEYDQVKAATKLDCKRRQQTFIQGTYFLNSKTVYERSAKASIVEEIEPGTVAEQLLLRFCE